MVPVSFDDGFVEGVEVPSEVEVFLEDSSLCMESDNLDAG